MAAPKAGYKGDVYLGDPTTRIASATWTYDGETRNMQAVDEFASPLILDVPLQIRGGNITITGNYKLDTDDGQKLVATNFKSGDPITNIMLYTDKTNNIYLMPDPDFVGDGSVASYCTVTNCRNVSDDKSGIGTISMTLLVSGAMKQMGDTAVVQVVTTGVHSIAAEVAELVGNLSSFGTEDGAIECYFIYGTTTEMVDGPSAPSDEYTEEIGLFGAKLTGLAAGTVYYKAVAKYNTTKYAYGAMKEFTALGA